MTKFSALFFIIFLGCSSEQSSRSVQKINKEPYSSGSSQLLLLYGKWQDLKDTSHQIVFSDLLWIDFYNGDTTSKNKIALFSDFPEKGGRADLSGSLIGLEESPGNFYYFKIQLLDSLNLVLDFVNAGTTYQLIRK